MKIGIERLQNNLSEKEWELADFMYKTVKEKFPELDRLVFSHSCWVCKDSPIGVCVYDGDEDDCIICNKPLERL